MRSEPTPLGADETLETRTFVNVNEIYILQLKGTIMSLFLAEGRLLPDLEQWNQYAGSSMTRQWSFYMKSNQNDASWLCRLPGCAPATLRSFWFQYGSLTRSWRVWHPSGRGRESLWWSTGTFHWRHTITTLTGLFSCSPTLKSDSKAPEERGCDRSVQPAWDQLVGLEEHRRRVLGDFNCKGLSDGYQGGLWSNSLPATWRSTRLLRQRFW